jgi:hypothetical protein
MYQIKQLLAEFEQEDALPAALKLRPQLSSIASAHEAKRPPPPPVTTTTTTSRTRPPRVPHLLQLQQQEAMAELQATMTMSLKPASMQMHQSLVADSPQQQQQQQQQEEQQQEHEQEQQQEHEQDHITQQLHSLPLQHHQQHPQNVPQEPSETTAQF